MTGFKTRLALVICAVALTSCQEGNGKHDLFGFHPGMTRTEARDFAASRKWNDDWKLLDRDEIRTDTGPMTVRYAPNLEGNPIMALELFMKDRERIPVEATAAEISAQYGKQPDSTHVVDGVIVEYRWKLDDGDELAFDLPSELVLVNKGLISNDEEAARAAAIQNTPKIKF
jgi:hypothetical protein